MLRTLVLAALASHGALAQEPAPDESREIAGKELTELLEDWPEQYVRWIITKAEKEVYEALETEEEKLKFIEFFWARRDPNPDTVDNEYRAEYLERYAWVANYLSAGKPGWSTDRGRIYLILGPPHSAERNPFGRWGAERPSEMWTYNNLDIPDFPASIDFQFVDFNGTGDFELVQDIDTAAPIWNQFGTVNNALDAIAQRRMRIGEIDPRTGRDRFDNVDNTRLVMNEFDLQKQVIQVFNTPGRDLPDLNTVVESRASFGNIAVAAAGGAVHGAADGFRVPVQVSVPYSQLGSREEEGQLYYDLDYVIVVSTEDGDEVARASDALTLSFDAPDKERLMEQLLSIQEVLEVPSGSYQVLAYVRDRRRNRLGNTSFPLNLTMAPDEAIRMSSVFLASELVPAGLEQARPFQFGNVRVVPALSDIYSSEDTLKLYVEAYGTSSGEDGRKRIRVDFFVMQYGRLHMGIPASHLRPDAEPVGITSQIPLRKLGPGAYVIRVRVTDELTGDKAESEASFAVQAAAPAQ